MDPPYESDLYGTVLQKIAETGILKQEGYLITERSSQIPLEIPAGMEVLREKAYKTTILTFLGLEETK
jgi:16S rRNA G966 N2-methylase RsmD